MCRTIGLIFRQALLGTLFAAISFAVLFPLLSPCLHAQATAAPQPDVIVFPDGEKLIGHFEGSTGASAKFKSDRLGEITVDLTKIQELHTTQKFAVIRKNQKFGRRQPVGQVPQGTIDFTNQTVQVSPGNGQPPESIALGDVSIIVDQADFERAFRSRSIFAEWKGAASLGVSLVDATQNSESFNTSANLVRTGPTETWLPPRDRTLILFSDTFGEVSQPGATTLKTSIFHAGAERDEYFTPRVYALAAVSFDHNFSQGLDLQQVYGGGIGWTVLQQPNQTLDLKGSINYERQSFQTSASDQSLIASVFAEDYNRKLPHGIVITQVLSATPAWTDFQAYSLYASAGITLPVYKRFGVGANIIDSYINDPPPGFKFNSIQFTTGVTYTLP